MGVGERMYTNNYKNQTLLIPSTGFINTPSWDGEAGSIAAWAYICDWWSVEALPSSSGLNGAYLNCQNSDGNYHVAFYTTCHQSLGLAVHPIKE